MTASRTFRVRHYECDAYGHLNNTAYLRYAEELEVAAGRAPGDLRSIDLTYVQPVGFEDSVEVTAAGEDGLRSYRFTSSGREVARGEAEWAPAAGAQPEQPPPPPERPFRQERRVGWRDVAESGRVDPAAYAALVEDCAMDLCATFGWPMERCSADGFAMVLRRHQIAYHRPLRLGDEYAITTYASDASRVSAVRHYLVDHADGEPAARFRSHYVWVDQATMRPIRIPSGFLGDFAANFSP